MSLIWWIPWVLLNFSTLIRSQYLLFTLAQRIGPYSCNVLERPNFCIENSNDVVTPSNVCSISKQQWLHFHKLTFRLLMRLNYSILIYGFITKLLLHREPINVLIIADDFSRATWTLFFSIKVKQFLPFCFFFNG